MLIDSITTEIKSLKGDIVQTKVTNHDEVVRYQSPRFSVANGSYILNLIYKNKAGNVIYRSCDIDAQTIHQITSEVYMPVISICPTYTIPDSIQSTRQSSQTALTTLSNVWTRCAEDTRTADYPFTEYTHSFDISKTTATYSIIAHKTSGCTPGDARTIDTRTCDLKVYELKNGKGLQLETRCGNGQFYFKVRLYEKALEIYEACKVPPFSQGITCDAISELYQH